MKYESSDTYITVVGEQNVQFDPSLTDNAFYRYNGSSFVSAWNVNLINPGIYDFVSEDGFGFVYNCRIVLIAEPALRVLDTAGNATNFLPVAGEENAKQVSYFNQTILPTVTDTEHFSLYVKFGETEEYELLHSKSLNSHMLNLGETPFIYLKITSNDTDLNYTKLYEVRVPIQLINNYGETTNIFSSSYDLVGKQTLEMMHIG